MTMYPHPDWGDSVMVDSVDIPWSTPEVGAEIEALVATWNGTPADAVAAVMSTLEGRYDSIDREWAFTMLSQTMGVDYEEFYQAWLATA